MRRHMLFLLAVPLLAAGNVLAQASQRPGNVTPGTPTQTPAIPGFPGDRNEPLDPLREYSRQRARETDRQKRIVDDANRLVKLTAQYRSDVEHHGTVTAEDQKLLMQIEKLAREVKDRMRGM